MIKLIFSLLSAILLVFTTASAQNIQCKLEGTVVDRPNSKTLFLAPDGTHYNTGKYIRVPIQKGVFSYTLTLNHAELYELVFQDELNNGAWRGIAFMAENGTITFELHPMDEPAKNRVQGGPLHERYNFIHLEPEQLFSTEALRRESDSLRKADNYYNAQGKALFAALKVSTSDKERDSLYKRRDAINLFTPAMTALDAQYDSLHGCRASWQLDQCEANQSEAELAILKDILYNGITYKRKEIDIPRAISIYERLYKKAYADNPMQKNLEELVGAATNLKVGGRYLDFTAPDLNGKAHKLSELIDGQVAIIDLWGSWCGPCMRTSKSLIPVYEKYKNKGLTVIGVAREQNDTKSMQQAIHRLGLPWLNLVDLNDSQKIWYLYGISNASGKVFLVDKTGTILAIDPTADQADKIIQNLIN